MTRGAVEKRARGDESTARATRARLRRALCACAALGAACAAASAALGSTQMVLNARLSEAARRATPERGLARGRVRAVSEARFAPPARGAARGRWRTRPRDDAGGDAATRGGDAAEATERRHDAFTRAVDEYEDVDAEDDDEAVDAEDAEDARRWAAMLGERRDE